MAKSATLKATPPGVDLADPIPSPRASSTSRYYQIFGLHVRSAVKLVSRALRQEPPRHDAEIRCGPVAPELPDAVYRGAYAQAGPSQWQLDMPGVARYRVSRGREIIVDAAAKASARDVRLFLVKRAFPALMLQRGCFPLHASAVRLGEGGLLICGHSGSGASALAATLRSLGHPLIADEVTYVSPQLEQVMIRPGLGSMYLWRDVAHALDEKFRPALRVRGTVQTSRPRFELPVKDSLTSCLTPVKYVVIMTQDDVETTEVEELLDAHAVSNALHARSPLGHFEGAMGHGAVSTVLAQAIAESSQAIVVRRPDYPPATREKLEETARAVLRAFA